MRHRDLEIVVHDADRPEASTFGQLALGDGDAPFGLFGRIAPPPQSLRLHLGRGRFEQDEERVGRTFEHLCSTLHVDLEDDIAVGIGVGPRCAVEVPEELGMLEEPIGLDTSLEGLAGDVGVRVVALSGPLRSSGPAARQPQLRIVGDDGSDDS